VSVNNMSQHHRDVFIKEIFTSIAPKIDFLSSFFSFGLDQGWRSKLVSVLALKEGEKVLDVCAGTGELSLLISEKVGEQGSIFAADFSAEMLGMANKKLNARTSNITFSLSDAKNLAFLPDSFDAVTVAFGMRNVVDTAAALQEAYRVLKPGGDSAVWNSPLQRQVGLNHSIPCIVLRSCPLSPRRSSRQMYRIIISQGQLRHFRLPKNSRIYWRPADLRT